MRVTTIALVMSLVVLTGGSPVEALQKKAVGAIRLAGFSAHLFYEPLGKVDPRDLVERKIVRWNTIIGEGEAEAPSNTTLVVVKLAGGPFLTGMKGTLSFKAKNDGKVLRSETVSLSSFFGEDESLAIPFVVTGTGCGRIELTAELKTPKGHQAKTETLVYPCGE